MSVPVRKMKQSNRNWTGSGITLLHPREYHSYFAAKARCMNPKNKDYKTYHGRGIKFLFKSFEQFLKVLGKCPQGRVLDRKDNDGNYTPKNCRWVTKKVSALNRRPWAPDDIRRKVFNGSSLKGRPSNNPEGRRCKRDQN